MKKDLFEFCDQLGRRAVAMNFKKQLTLLLESRGMSAAELSRRSKVPKQSISGWLGGSNPRDIKQVKQVADVFGVSIDHLFFGNGIQQKENDVLSSFNNNEWIGGTFEVKVRRVK